MDPQQTAPRKVDPAVTTDADRVPDAGQATVPAVQDLTALRTRLEQRHAGTLGRVESLMESQQSLTSTLAGEISAIREDGDRLHQLEEQSGADPGLLGSLARRLGRRSRMLERRTVAGRLHDQYAEVHTTLRKASAFADELRLCAVELAAEVDHLHGEVEASLADIVRLEARMAAIDQELLNLEEDDGVNPQRKADQLTFERADLRTGVDLLNAKAQLCAREVEPVRTLRETVQSMHQEMAQYVLHASASVEGSGRRIQALGLAADAPIVVSELQAGLDQLDLAMSATEAYLEQAHELLTRVLPALSEQIRLQGSQSALELEAGLSAIAQARGATASDADLKAAALAEVELLGVDLPDSSR